MSSISSPPTLNPPIILLSQVWKARPWAKLQIWGKEYCLPILLISSLSGSTPGLGDRFSDNGVEVGGRGEGGRDAQQEDQML